LLKLAKFSVSNAKLKVTGKNIDRARLSELSIKQKIQTNEDSLIIDSIGPDNYDPDRILVEDCEVQGGSDGVVIDTHVHLLRCTITGAAARGIFANSDFVIENCTVLGCGSYGMKTRSGCERRGRNQIQPGPWDNHMQFFGNGGMYGAYGDDDDNDDEDEYDSGEEYGAFGFTHNQEMELWEQGVKPWDEDAHAVLDALRSDW
jgi:hypothetical protein